MILTFLIIIHIEVIVDDYTNAIRNIKITAIIQQGGIISFSAKCRKIKIICLGYI